MLKRWLADNVDHPYPSSEEKEQLRRCAGMTATQLNDWFVNARRRVLPGIR
ncbi:homeobox KN domain-containing protein, partial [Syncephalis pseudoplumigaleata]